MRRSQGFSLIELMVAMLVGLIVIGGGIYVYVSSQRNLNEVHANTEVSENGRFALYVLSNALREAGFMGEVSPSNIEIRVDIPVGVGGDCVIRSTEDNDAVEDWPSQLSAENLTTPVFVDFVNVNEAFSVVQDKAPGQEGCIELRGANQPGFLPFEGKTGSHLLVTKRARAQPLGSVSDVATEYGIVANHNGGALYAASFLENSMIELGAEFAGGQFWEYEYEKFFVDDNEDGVPTLYRQSIESEGPEALVSGIEEIRIRFNQANGDLITLDPDGTYPTSVNYSEITLAEVFVLARSTEEVRAGATNMARTFDLGGISKDFDDGFRREVFTTTVTLRNPSMWALGEL